jgi:hypothetical protein
MPVEPVEDDSVILRCSDGYGSELTFEDLVVRVDSIRHAES